MGSLTVEKEILRKGAILIFESNFNFKKEKP